VSFERLFKADMLTEGFGTARYTRAFRERAHISKSKLEMYSNVRYLNVKGLYTARYVDDLSVRYASALNMSYDLLISIFDVDRSESLICRSFKFDANMKSQIERYLDSIRGRRPNLEARLIGLQNNQEHGFLFDVAELIASRGLPLVEVDLFGDELRHIAIDTKLGVGYNVLLEDRLYKALELKNKMTIEQFERSIMQNP
jgi:hypothetical protein